MEYDYDRRVSRETAKLDRTVRQKANRDLERAGLDGNGRFKKPGEALSYAFKALARYGMEPDEMVDGFLLSRPQGSVNIDMAFSNEKDSFSPISITNTMLRIQWTDLGGKRYEVIGYLS